jgi:hypothetical protein
VEDIEDVEVVNGRRRLPHCRRSKNPLQPKKKDTVLWGRKRRLSVWEEALRIYAVPIKKFIKIPLQEVVGSDLQHFPFSLWRKTPCRLGKSGVEEDLCWAQQKRSSFIQPPGLKRNKVATVKRLRRERSPGVGISLTLAPLLP